MNKVIFDGRLFFPVFVLAIAVLAGCGSGDSGTFIFPPAIRQVRVVTPNGNQGSTLPLSQISETDAVYEDPDYDEPQVLTNATLYLSGSNLRPQSGMVRTRLVGLGDSSNIGSCQLVADSDRDIACTLHAQARRNLALETAGRNKQYWLRLTVNGTVSNDYPLLVTP